MTKLRNYLIKALGGVSIEDVNRKLNALEAAWHEIILSEEQTRFYRGVIMKKREHQKELERALFFGMELFHDKGMENIQEVVK